MRSVALRLLLVLTFVLAACGADHRDGPLVAQGMAAEACLDAHLTAFRSYDPLRRRSGTAEFSRQIAFAIPPTMAVTAGNAGSGVAALVWSVAGQEVGRCRYRGGDGGLQYVFHRCVTGQQAAQIVYADGVELHVSEGDPSAGTTSVSLVLTEASPNCAPIGLLPAPPLDAGRPARRSAARGRGRACRGAGSGSARRGPRRGLRQAIQ